MSGAPWWVSLAVGIGTAIVTILGVMLSSGRQLAGLRERIDADLASAGASMRGSDRSEWFRRVQWAHGLLQQTQTEVMGGKVLRALADQADDADAALISAVVDGSSAVQESASARPWAVRARLRRVLSGRRAVAGVDSGREWRDTDSGSITGA